MIKTLDKLTYEQHNSPLNYVDFCEAFSKKNHFQLCGKGMFAKVYGKKTSQFVYKVGVIEKTPQTDPYFKFISSLEKGNPFFPTINTVTVFKHENTYFYVIEMEKLFCRIPKRLNELSAKIVKILDNLFQGRHFSGIKKMWEKYCSQFQQDPYVLNLLVCLKNLLNKYAFDLHPKNMMMRKDGQIVITDPVCPKNIITPKKV